MAQERTPLTRRCLSGHAMQDEGKEDSRVRLCWFCEKGFPFYGTMVLALVHDSAATILHQIIVDRAGPGYHIILCTLLLERCFFTSNRFPLSRNPCAR